MLDRLLLSARDKICNVKEICCKGYTVVVEIFWCSSCICGSLVLCCHTTRYYTFEPLGVTKISRKSTKKHSVTPWPFFGSFVSFGLLDTAAFL